MPRPLSAPRRTRAFALDDWLSLAGPALAALALVDTAYEHLLDGSGPLGFGVCWYVAFVAIYAAVLGLGHPRPVVAERVVAATLWIVALGVVAALLSTVGYTFLEGWRALVHGGFYVHDMAAVSPTAPLGKGGIFHAVVGTVVEIAIAIAVSTPIGIGTAVFLSEMEGATARIVRTVVEAMTALPEILAGLFVYAVLIVGLGMSKSGMAVAVAMSVTMIPIIARAGEIGLRVVPGGLREASAALGVNHWRTVRKVVLPTARAGLATGIILAVARGIGETAIVLILSGASSFLTLNPFGVPMNSLPLYIYSGYITHEPLAITRAFGAASVLLAIVLVLFACIRLLVRGTTVAR